MTRENMRCLGNGFYLCRTQAGFRKAVKTHFVDRMDIVGFPKSYPSLVHLSAGYCGYHYVLAECLPVSEVLSAITASDSGAAI